MDENKDKVIRRLKKLMALTGSSNANEASAALARAQKLARTAHEVELAERWLEKKYTRTVTRNARESGKTRDNDNARNSGYLEGRQASLHHPVNGQEQAKLGVSS
ncbi:DUF2786 domain-containing protein [Salmonella enterica subsp. diarizonae]|nr:DUF2786 domain-containing protein [Salmonella enterica subsp. diarizonae]ECJ5865871.1 DUF2786 domain-containing protein [Salmonella enterica subsp. diarizonae]EEB6127339.1 DUF2786 domain-containing protein [Salmonella enterica subsp. diarizonae]